MNGQKEAELAMVGMHVVGSTKGHPEMIWATFEHIHNAPNGEYQYINTSGETITVPQDTSGNWLFSAANSNGPFNVAHMRADHALSQIDSVSPFTISPSDTIRWKSWGGDRVQERPENDVPPNPIVASTAESNTEIISINNSVRGMLASGDIRGNYIMTGATWTALGNAPTGQFGAGGNEVGTSQLSNATMETYQQGSNMASGSNCFSCHRTNTVQVSHMFCEPGTDCNHGLKPLTLP
jgi:hypothetical protein